MLRRLAAVLLLATVVLVVSASAAAAQTTNPPEQTDVIVPVAVLAAVIYALIGFAKLVRNADWNGAKTQAIVWAASILGVVLVSVSELGSRIDVLGIPLDDASWPLRIIVGLVPAAIGITGYDVKKAIDNSDTSNSLPLFTHLPGALGGKKQQSVEAESLEEYAAAFPATQSAEEAFGEAGSEEPPPGVVAPEDAHDGEDAPTP